MLNFANFHSCHEKWMKVGQNSYKTLAKVHGIWQKFSGSFTFGFYNFFFHFVSLMNEIFRFNQNSQLPKPYQKSDLKMVCEYALLLIFHRPFTQGAHYLIRDDIKVVWAKFSTLSQTVLLPRKVNA